MTIADCWKQMKDIAPDDMSFHLDMSAKRSPRRDDEIEFNVFVWRHGMMKNGEANRCEDVVPVFRSLLLQLGERPPAIEILRALDCELGANA